MLTFILKLDMMTVTMSFNELLVVLMLLLLLLLLFVVVCFLLFCCIDLFSFYAIIRRMNTE